MTFAPRWLALLGLAALVIGVGTVIARRETPQQPATLGVLTGQVADTLHAVDRVEKLATPVSSAEEIDIGRALAAQVRSCDPDEWRDGAERCRADEAYLNGVVRLLALKGGLRRPEIPYEAHLVNSAEVNASALPGGQLFVTAGMMNFLDNEAETAAILGHEMAHVDLKHCIEQLQVERAAGRLGRAPLAELAAVNRIFNAGFSATLELEADRQGIRYAARAGYHPQGAVSAMQRIWRMRAGQRPPRAIGDELGEMTAGAVEGYFRSHPGDNERITRDEATVRQQGYDLLNTPWYVGRKNFTRRVPRRKQEYPDEFMKGKIFPPPDGWYATARVTPP